MLAPCVVTQQNQYVPANAERMVVHCLESGCIGKYIPSGGDIAPLGAQDCPRAIFQASGCMVVYGYNTLNIDLEDPEFSLIFVM